MSWSIPFYYSSEEEYKQNSIGEWLNSLVSPLANTTMQLLLVIGGVLIIAFILFRKMKVI
jgi:hypothetical protein